MVQKACYWPQNHNHYPVKDLVIIKIVDMSESITMLLVLLQ